MKPRQLSPRKLDIGAFIESQAELQGQAALADLPRVAAGLAPEADLSAVPSVSWRAQGRLVPQRVGGPQLWLDLTAHASLPLTCQRCLHPVTLPVEVDRTLRFVSDEAQAAQLDADLDDDVLALSRAFDLLDLIEDELIMASPLVPRHEACPEAPIMSVSDPGVDDDADDAAGAVEGDTPAVDGESGGRRPNPFAVLAQLKKKPGTGGEGQGSA